MKSQDVHKKIFEAVERFLAATVTKCAACGEVPELVEFKYSSNHHVYETKFDLKGWSRVSRADVSGGGPIPSMSMLLCGQCAASREVAMPQTPKGKE